jgi:putative nucleotidyltransferase with HDIG domain
VPVQVSSAPYFQNGQFAGTLSVLADITERKQRESELEVIASTSAALRTTLTRAELLPAVLERVTQLLQVDAAALVVQSPGGTGTRVEHASGGWTHWKAAQELPGQGEIGYVISTGQAYHTRQVSRELALGGPGGTDLACAAAFLPMVAQEKVIGAVCVGRQVEFTEAEMSLLNIVSDIAAHAIQNALLFEEVRDRATQLAEVYDTTLEGWSRALDLRDRDTEGHTQRVTQMTMRLAQEVGIGEQELVHVQRGGLLHDIGKMGIPDNILHKAGPLTDEEWQVMRKHPEYALEMLVQIAYLRPALDIPYCHHERWDGSGYPRGLKGQEIPLSARVFAIADVWDALRSDRPYRHKWDEVSVRKYIQSEAGNHFDPEIVAVFLQMQLQYERRESSMGKYLR